VGSAGGWQEGMENEVKIWLVARTAAHRAAVTRGRPGHGPRNAHVPIDPPHAPQTGTAALEGGERGWGGGGGGGVKGIVRLQ